MKGKQGGEGEPGAAIPGATLRMSEWPPRDQEVSHLVYKIMTFGIFILMLLCTFLLDNFAGFM